MELARVLTLLVAAVAWVRCEPNFRWTLLREGGPSEGTTFEIENDETNEKHRLRIMQSPCSCEGLLCNCCMGFNFDRINFRREGCMNFGFDPMEFALSMQIMMNDNVVWENSISGKNPPPLCLPLPIPGGPAINLEMCMKMYDIYFPGQNIHMCMDVDMKSRGSPFMVLHFDCMRMGMDGVALMKPGETVELEGNAEVEAADGDADDFYDPVTEDRGAASSAGSEKDEDILSEDSKDSSIKVVNPPRDSSSDEGH